MKRKSMSPTDRPAILAVFVLAVMLFAASSAQAQTYSVLYRFGGGTDGGYPLDGLVIGPAGNLFGTASIGGTYGAGVVFKFTESGEETILYNFTGGADGANPNSSLISDTSGNLYGTTYAGGASGAGIVFVLTPSGIEKVLYSFTGGLDGANPIARLSFDASGSLYGTTFAGGAYGGGTVFKVFQNGMEKVLHSFGNGTDGANPVAGVTLTEKGNIFGTTSAGGMWGYGTVFALASTQSGWQEAVLYSFQFQSDGATPYGGVVFDKAGNLYGTTTSGGNGGGGGTVFKMSYSAGVWTFNVLDGLAGSSVSGTYRNVLLDTSGNIYATTHCDGEFEYGTVYKLTPSWRTWTYATLYTFTGGTDGGFSYSNLVFDKQGNL